MATCDRGRCSDSDNASIVVSGISGRFPNAENVEKLWNNIRKNGSGNRKPKEAGSESAPGKLRPDLNFDADFFGFGLSTTSTNGNGENENSVSKLPLSVGPLLEVIYETILDSGTAPSELCQQKAGLFIASTNSHSDSEESGSISERVATIFHFQGPKVMTSSSLVTLKEAVDAIQAGECDHALVAVAELNPQSDETENESKMADEAIAAIFIQKRDTARREYVRLLEIGTHVDANSKRSDGSDLGFIVGLTKLILHVQHGASLENYAKDKFFDIKHENGTQTVEVYSAVDTDTNTPGSLRLKVHIPGKDAPGAPGRRTLSHTPVLIPFAGRTKEGVHDSMQKILFHPRNLQFDILLQHIATDNKALWKIDDKQEHSWMNPIRGYLIRQEASVESSYKEKPTQKMPLWLIFSGTPGSLWPGMANDLIKFEVFASSIQKSAEILKPFGVDLHHIIMQGDAATLDRYLGTGYIAMGIAFIDLLRAVGVEADGYIGHSGGELLCGYWDGCLSHEEALISYYWKDEHVQSCLGGTMASVALTWEQACKKCPPWIYPACHNSKTNVTVAGLAKDVPAFLADLRTEGVLGFEVNSGGVAYHTRYLKPMLADFEGKLREVFKPETVIRQRSKKFVSTSIPEKDWAKSHRDGDDMVDYIVNNIRKPVLFHPILKHIPRHSVVIEVSPNAHMIAILEKTLGKTCGVWCLEKQDGGNNAVQLLAGLGKLYEHGHNLKISNLYPEPQFPVQIGTPMISPLVIWNRGSSK